MTHRILLAAPLALLLAAGALAQPVDTDRIARLAEQLLDTGADGAALKTLADADHQSLQALEALGEARADALRDAWNAAFAEAALRDDVVAAIASRESAAEVEAALRWLGQPEVAAATGLMRSHSGPEGDRAFARWATTLSDGDIDERRAEVIASISERSGEGRSGDLVISLAEIGLRGGHAAAPPNSRPPLADPLNHFHDLAPTVRDQAISQNRLYLYFVLRDLSIPQLQAYAAALDQRPGRWYVRAMHDALQHAVDQAGQRLVAHVEQRVAGLR
jgi:hypothetical protein